MGRGSNRGMKGKVPNPLKLGLSAAKKSVSGAVSGAAMAGGVAGGVTGFMSQPGKQFVRKVKDSYSPEEAAIREVYRKCLEKVHLLDGLPAEVEYAINCLETVSFSNRDSKV